MYTQTLDWIVFPRWLRDENNLIIRKEGHPILEVVVIQRKDTGEWAIPGVRMVSYII